MKKESGRAGKRYRLTIVLLSALASSALLAGFATTPAFADHKDRGAHSHHHRGEYYKHDKWRPRPQGYWAPGYYGPPPVVYYPPPPVYYAPPPPPVYYGAPSLNVVIPIR